jgi:hypothetical protein
MPRIWTEKVRCKSHGSSLAQTKQDVGQNLITKSVEGVSLSRS